ncbi:MAG: lysophospholipid transporter LplT [Betaproteobacteria bacterium]|nr:lysophospholipid transporter LplT [Betaproteobacteria bacterium]
MPLGFYTIMAAQFFSALADNALLIAAIAALRDMNAPPEYEPLLKTFFAFFYVAMAAFVGAFADSMPKGRVMFISNTIKIAGCAMMFFSIHPLLAYAVVGFGAAAYSPAKYGILTEYLPHRLLIAANGWIEGLTVAAIVLGVVLGGFLIRPEIAQTVARLDLPLIGKRLGESNETALLIIALLYLIAALFNLYVPRTNVDHKPLKKNPLYLMHEFGHCLGLLWRDRLGQISLGVTTLFWGAGATLQFIIIQWADEALGLGLSQSSMLQGVVAIGVAAGAIVAAKYVKLKDSLKVIPLGIMMGFVVCALLLPHVLWSAIGLLLFVGILSGLFVVPMNALLQHRGHILMGAGHSIAVQNFNENLSILIMTVLYYGMIKIHVPINFVIVLFGALVAGIMYLLKLRHEAHQRRHDDLRYLDTQDNFHSSSHS